MSQHPRRRYTIGIDIGGTKILAGLLSPSFQRVSEIKSKTRPEKGEDNFLGELEDSVKFLLKDEGISKNDVAGIGIGCPGFIDSTRGVIAGSPNIPFLRNYPLARKVLQRTGLRAILGNDVQTGLYGEHQFGAAKGFQNVIGIFMGTGIGGAFILDGKPYVGSTGTAGEIGHVQIHPDGPRCGCGNRGCFEAYAGRLAISAEAAILVARQKAPHLAQKAGTDLRGIKSGGLAKAIAAGDSAVRDLIRMKAELVGRVMANLVNVVNPDLIVLGGGVVEAMPSLIVRTAEQAMRATALGPAARHVRVTAARLKDYSIVMGAAKRASDTFGEKRVGERRR